MNYTINGRTIRIPDKEIENSMKYLNISKEDAIQMYLEDNEILINEEQKKLDQKAKDNRITATIHQAKATKSKDGKTQKERVQKEDPTKEYIVAECAKFIENLCGNATIANKTKLITFDYNGDHFKLDLIRQKKKENAETVL